MIRLPLLLVPLLVLLAACGPLVRIGNSRPPPESLLALASGIEGQVQGPASFRPDEAITIDLPAVPGALQTVRVPVRVSDSEIRYVVAAQWSEAPNRLFRHLLADRLTADGLPILDLEATGAASGRRLAGQLLEFGVDLRHGQSVRVRYDAALLAPGGPVRRQSFVAEEPLASVDGVAAAAALNKAALSVASAVSAWIRASS